MKKKLKLIIKITVSILIIGYILSKLDLTAVWENLTHANILLFLLVIVSGIINNFLCTWRWSLINKRIYNINIPYLKMVKLYFIGAFFNLFLPTNIGGDAVKAYHSYKESQNNKKVVYSIILDRVTGLLILLLIGYFSLAIAIMIKISIDERIIKSLLIFLGILCVGFIMALCIHFTKNGFLLKNRFFTYIKNITDDFFLLIKKPRLLSSTSLISIIFQLLSISNSYILAAAIGLHIPFIYFLIFIPIISIVITLPISFFGIGIRETLYVILFSTIGVIPEKIISVSFLSFLVLVVLGLSGGVIYALNEERSISD